MKIGNPAEKPAAHAANSTPAAALDATKPGSKAAGPDASATVALSSAASTLMVGGASPDIDAAKVDKISKAIADGTFKVNPETIADKLIANAQELLGKSRG